MRKKLLPALMVILALFITFGMSSCSKGEEEKPVVSIIVLTPEEGENVDLIKPQMRSMFKDYSVGKSEKYYNDEDYYEPNPVYLSWEDVDGVDSYTVAISDDEDMEDAKEYKTKESELKLYNIDTDERYYWQVKTETEEKIYESDVTYFTVVDGPEIIRADGTFNLRDFGGEELNGIDINDGLIYRSGNLDDITESGINVLSGELGIKTDLDLRKPGEGRAGDGSPLGGDTNYINISGVEYADAIDSEYGKSVMGDELRVFANRENYPIIVHCIYGRDRTGTLMYVLKALVGVSEEDILRDYELSLLSNKAYTKRSAESLVERIKNFSDKIKDYGDSDTSLQECAVRYAKDCGLTDDEIETIQNQLAYDD